MSPEETTEHILRILREHGEGDYIGEAISQLEHSLQAAQLASSAGATRETVLAALLHDIGQFLPAEELEQEIQELRRVSRPHSHSPSPSSPAAAAAAAAAAGSPFPPSSDETKEEKAKHGSESVGRASHDALGAAYLGAHGFSPKVCALVGAHVDAKRYLCAVEPSYGDAVLSDASRASLALQGGPMSRAEAQRWHQSSPWAHDMARLRRWDDAAKVPGLRDVPSLDAYRDAMVAHLREQCSTSLLPGEA